MYSRLKNSSRTLTCLALSMGLSMSLYAAGPNPDTTPTTSAAPPTSANVETTTTKTTTVVKKVHHYKAHKAHHHAAAKADVATDTSTTKTETTADGAAGAAASPATGTSGPNYTPKHTVMKNGVILNDVEPTPASQSDAPSSTSDTLKGGVTTTIGQ